MSEPAHKQEAECHRNVNAIGGGPGRPPGGRPHAQRLASAGRGQRAGVNGPRPTGRPRLVDESRWKQRSEFVVTALNSRCFAIVSRGQMQLCRQAERARQGSGPRVPPVRSLPHMSFTFPRGNPAPETFDKKIDIESTRGAEQVFGASPEPDGTGPHTCILTAASSVYLGLYFLTLKVQIMIPTSLVLSHTKKC